MAGSPVQLFMPTAKHAARNREGQNPRRRQVWKAFTKRGWIWQDIATPDYQHFIPVTRRVRRRPIPPGGSVGHAEGLKGAQRVARVPGGTISAATLAVGFHARPRRGVGDSPDSPLCTDAIRV